MRFFEYQVNIDLDLDICQLHPFQIKQLVKTYFWQLLQVFKTRYYHLQSQSQLILIQNQFRYCLSSGGGGFTWLIYVLRKSLTWFGKDRILVQ